MKQEGVGEYPWSITVVIMVVIAIRTNRTTRITVQKNRQVRSDLSVLFIPFFWLYYLS